ncbi:MAG: entericidin, EcnA/B family [Natronohydrobacter sp.]|nr:entericidin, EcnA/B family [Natronohydrobacter sp.]
MKFTLATMLLISALTLSACNTVEGAGRDMTAAGVAIQQEARSAR